MEIEDTPTFDLNTPLGLDVPLARFTANRKDIGTDEREPPRVKVAFMSPRQEPDTGHWALSTSRIDGLSDDGRKAFGQAWVERHVHPDRTVKAYCALSVRVFETVREGVLRADFDNEPPRHVNVLGWPEDESAQLDIAQQLCALIETEGYRERY